MKSYKKKFIRQSVDRRINSKRESMTAIVWSVNTTTKTAGLKIQGSNQIVTARYNENIAQKPDYLKPGNAVRLTRMGGSSGTLEITGHGLVIPTPVAGESTPPISETGDAILSGGQLQWLSGMQVLVTAGTVRIAGTIYSFPETILTFNTPPAGGYYRYDIIEVGTDGVVHIKEGDVATNPAMPATDASHVRISWVLIYGGTTELNPGNIGGKFNDPYPCQVNVSVADDELAWAQLTTNITIQILDQYGHPIVGNYEVTIAFYSGNGTLDYEDSTTSTTSLTANIVGNSQIVFGYTRNQETSDASPDFNIVVVSELTGLNIRGHAHITLLDINGDEMYGDVDPPAGGNDWLDGREVALTCADAVTADLSLGGTFYMVLDRASTEITLSNPSNGKVYRIRLTQDGTGGRVVTWADTIIWKGGSPPTLTTTLNKSDWVTLVRSAGAWYADINKNF